MAQKLFIGSLPYGVDDEQLGQIFSEVGTVVSAKVIIDRDSGRSKGFGFVEMSTDDEAKAAVDQLNGKEIAGRTINVSEARPQQPREGGFSGGNRGGGNGGGGNGGGSFRERRY